MQDLSRLHRCTEGNKRAGKSIAELAAVQPQSEACLTASVQIVDISETLAEETWLESKSRQCFQLVRPNQHLSFTSN